MRSALIIAIGLLAVGAFFYLAFWGYPFDACSRNVPFCH